MPSLDEERWRERVNRANEKVGPQWTGGAVAAEETWRVLYKNKAYKLPMDWDDLSDSAKLFFCTLGEVLAELIQENSMGWCVVPRHIHTVVLRMINIVDRKVENLEMFKREIDKDNRRNPDTVQWDNTAYNLAIGELSAIAGDLIAVSSEYITEKVREDFTPSWVNFVNEPIIRDPRTSGGGFGNEIDPEEVTGWKEA
jgi:hypothetical protein